MDSRVLSIQIPAEHPCFDGHFPGRPIVPGVLLLDAVLQALEMDRAEGSAGEPSAFELPVCKFLQPVLPGTRLDLRLDRASAPDTLNFRLEREGRIVASGTVRRKAGPA